MPGPTITAATAHGEPPLGSDVAQGRCGRSDPARRCATIALFGDTAGAVFAQWLHSSAYNHSFLILPIVGYLIWNRRQVLAGCNHLHSFPACCCFRRSAPSGGWRTPCGSPKPSSSRSPSCWRPSFSSSSAGRSTGPSVSLRLFAADGPDRRFPARIAADPGGPGGFAPAAAHRHSGVRRRHRHRDAERHLRRRCGVRRPQFPVVFSRPLAAVRRSPLSPLAEARLLRRRRPHPGGRRPTGFASMRSSLSTISLTILPASSMIICSMAGDSSPS